MFGMELVAMDGAGVQAFVEDHLAHADPDAFRVTRSGGSCTVDLGGNPLFDLTTESEPEPPGTARRCRPNVITGESEIVRFNTKTGEVEIDHDQPRPA